MVRCIPGIQQISKLVINKGYPRFNIIYLFSLFYRLLSGLGLLLRMFFFLSFTSAVRNKLYYPGDEP